MFDTPDASPTWFAGTAAVAADDAGPFDSPIPTAMAISGRTKIAYVQVVWVRPITTNPAVGIANPAATTCRPPNLAASRGTNGATTTSPAVAGRVARPAWSGLNPRAAGSWKYRLNRYISALMVPAPIRIAIVEPTRTRFRSSARSSSGTLTRCSTSTNATPQATPMTSEPSVASEAQPQSLPLLSARMTGPRVRATRIVPAKSIDRDRFGSRESVTVAAVMTMQTTPTTASTQNRPCQPVMSTSTPPTSGPAAAPIAAPAP